MNEQNKKPDALEALSVDESRMALAEFLARGGDDDNRSAKSIGGLKDSNSDDQGQTYSGAVGSGWTSLASAGFAAWWDNHPLKAGVSVVASSAEQYARRRPLHAISIAAAAGAALVLFRPWRLVSATALVATVLKSSNFAGVAASMFDRVTRSSVKVRS
jgi:hypothetical protein